MGLLTKETEVKIGVKNLKYYEKLGYKIPTHEDCNNKVRTKRGEIIKVKVEDLTNGSHSLVDVKCDGENCNKTKTMMYKNYKDSCRDNGMYYCNSCANKLNSGSNAYWYGKGYLLTKENNSNWNPNITQEERETKRNTLENKEWIKKCLYVADYKSQISDKHNNNLAVHHLNDWANHREQRYDINNGIVLTKEEHKAFHNWQKINYPKQPCTKEQFEEWIGHIISPLEYDGELVTRRKVYCIETNRIYENADEVAIDLGLNDITCIYATCNHKSYSKDGRTYNYKLVKNKHLLWLDEYEKMTKEDLLLYLNESKLHNKKEVYCITTSRHFNSIKEGAEEYNIKNSSSIVGCCKHLPNYKHAGFIIDETGTKIKLEWMYHEDWLKYKLNK